MGVCWESNGESDINCRRLYEFVVRAMESLRKVPTGLEI